MHTGGCNPLIYMDIMGKNKEFDLDELFNLAKIGLTEEQIATSLGVHQSTMTRRKKDDADFAETLKAGKQAGITAVTNALFTGATNEAKPSTSAQIFFLKNRARWTDRIETEHTGSVGFDVQLDSALSTLKEAGIDPASL